MTTEMFLAMMLWFAPGTVLQTAAHEGSHAAVILAGGGTIERIEILPHKFAGQWRMGGTYFATQPERYHNAMAVAPFATAIGISLATAGLSRHVDNQALKGVLIAQSLLAIIDAANWLRSTQTGGDGLVYAEGTGVHPNTVALAGGLILTTFAVSAALLAFGR